MAYSAGLCEAAACSQMMKTAPFLPLPIPEDESADSDEAVKNVPAPVQRSTKSQKPAAVGKRRKPTTTKRRSRPRRQI